MPFNPVDYRPLSVGGAGELCYLDGSYLPFAKTKAEREATHDGRHKSATEPGRLRSQGARPRTCSPATGYMLPEDAERIHILPFMS
jgi:hypothetical protein